MIAQLIYWPLQSLFSLFLLHSRPLFNSLIPFLSIFSLIKQSMLLIPIAHLCFFCSLILLDYKYSLASLFIILYLKRIIGNCSWTTIHIIQFKISVYLLVILVNLFLILLDYYLLQGSLLKFLIIAFSFKAV